MGLTVEEVRARLEHPIVDCDGHHQEMLPLLEEYIRSSIAPKEAEAIVATFLDPSRRWQEHKGKSARELRSAGVIATSWWASPAVTVDRASAFLPALLASRLDELGIDFGVLYPSLGLRLAGLPQEDQRRPACRRAEHLLLRFGEAPPGSALGDGVDPDPHS